MSEDGDLWRAIKEDSQKKRADNREKSTALIMDWAKKNKGIVMIFNEAHLRVNSRFDFWAGTGKYLDRTTGVYYRGVFNLIKALDRWTKSTK